MHQALKAAESSEDPERKAIILLEISGSYASLGDKIKTLSIIVQALKAIAEMPEDEGWKLDEKAYLLIYAGYQLNEAELQVNEDIKKALREILKNVDDQLNWELPEGEVDPVFIEEEEYD